jgi:hypothetical protein
MRRPLIAASFAAAAALAQPAKAGEPASPPLKVWVNPGFYAYHFDRHKDLRDRDFGFGVEVEMSPRYLLTAGSYSNSNGARSHYAGLLWRPLQWRRASGVRIAGGAALAAIDGYPGYDRGGWFVAALPMLSIEGDRLGLNIGVIPTLKNRIEGALVFQVRLRVW